MFSEPIQVITICVLVFTLLAIVVTCETLTRKAQLRHTQNYYTAQLNTLATTTQELLEAFNTVTAERDALKAQRNNYMTQTVRYVNERDAIQERANEIDALLEIAKDNGFIVSEWEPSY